MKRAWDGVLKDVSTTQSNGTNPQNLTINEIRADERARVLSELRPLIEDALDGTQSDLGLSARRKLRKAVGL